MSKKIASARIWLLGQRVLMWLSVLLSWSVVFECSGGNIAVQMLPASDNSLTQWLQGMDEQLCNLERAMWHESCSSRFQLCCCACKRRIATQTDRHRLNEFKHVIEANPEYALAPHSSPVNRARSRTLIDACVAQGCPRLFKWLLTHGVHPLDLDNRHVVIKRARRCYFLYRPLLDYAKRRACHDDAVLRKLDQRFPQDLIRLIQSFMGPEPGQYLRDFRKNGQTLLDLGLEVPLEWVFPSPDDHRKMHIMRRLIGLGVGCTQREHWHSLQRVARKEVKFEVTLFLMYASLMGLAYSVLHSSSGVADMIFGLICYQCYQAFQFWRAARRATLLRGSDHGTAASGPELV